MSDQKAFLAAIRATPADDLPRLVLADWLDENGQPERAEFIRVQCALAKMGGAIPNAGKVVWLERRGELQGREQELWVSNGEDWCEEFYRTTGIELYKREGSSDRWSNAKFHPELAGEGRIHPRGNGNVLFVFTFRRGFVAEVRCNLADWYGRPCPSCDVGPGVRRYHTTGGDWDEAECNVCRGTNYTHGIGPRIMQEHPVTKVVLTDREPQLGNPTYWGPVNGFPFTWTNRHYTYGDDASHVIPQALFDLIEPESDLTPEEDERYAGRLKATSVVWYKSAESAHAALSAVLVRWAKLNRPKTMAEQFLDRLTGDDA